MNAIRVVVADDHEVVRRGVVSLLESQGGCSVVGEAANGREAVMLARTLKPDVVVLDISMPELSGIEATRQILEAVPETEVLILTMHESDALVRRLLEAGARGYVSKSDVGRNLIDAVQALRRHQVFLTSSAAAAVVGDYLRAGGETKPDTELTPRQLEVLQLLTEGKGNKEIATILGVSVFTAETHRRNIMRKLDCHSVAQLIRYSMQNQLFDAH